MAAIFLAGFGGLIMSSDTADTVIDENSRLLDTELPESEAGIDDVACIAQAIAERMSPEWRKCVDQEQGKRTPASLSPSETSRSSVAQGRVAGVGQKRANEHRK